MIIKSKGRKSKTGINQLLEYILNPEVQFRDQNGKALLVKNNLRGTNIDDWCREYMINETYRIHKKKNTNKVYHEIISFHAGDTAQINLSILEAIAREYIRVRNPNALSVITAHGDRDHIHLHAAISGVEYKTGKSLRVDKSVFNDMVASMERYQEKNFPNLVFSIVDFSKKSLNTDKEYQMKLRTGEPSEKEVIKAIAEISMEKAKSLNEFVEIIKAQGLEVYIRNGIPSGIIGKRKYRFSSLGISLEKFEREREGKNRDKKEYDR